MKARYWRRALEATVKFPYVWWVIFRIMGKGDKMNLLDRFIESFFGALKTVGLQWEIALLGYPEDR
jgi:hypothetical protein